MILILLKLSLVNNVYAQIEAGQQNAQNYFYDFIPDTTLYKIGGQITDQYYDLDLNFDGTIDYQLKIYGTYSPGHTHCQWLLICYNDNQAVMDSLGFADTLNYLQMIDQNSMWSTNDSLLLGRYYSLNLPPYNTSYTGPWCSSSAPIDNYIGLRLFSSGDTIYSYVHLYRHMIWNLIIKDFGIDILSVGYSELLNSEENFLFPNPSDGFFSIKSNSNFFNGYLQINNSLGQIVYSKNISSDQQELDLRFLKPGVYYLNFNGAEKHKFQKLIIK